MAWIESCEPFIRNEYGYGSIWKFISIWEYNGNESFINDANIRMNSGNGQYNHGKKPKKGNNRNQNQNQDNFD